jgi:hypothetical protein
MIHNDVHQKLVEMADHRDLAELDKRNKEGRTA